jgi:hypothetical protein
MIAGPIGPLEVVARIPAGVVTTSSLLIELPGVIIYVVHKSQALSDLACREIVLVMVPAAGATGIVAAVADAIPFESYVGITQLGFQRIQSERRILAINTCTTNFRLDLQLPKGSFQIGRARSY